MGNPERDALAAINKIAAELGYTGRRQNNFLYWENKGDFFLFGYTPHRQKDGKFYALKYRAGTLVKKVVFGRRKTAQKRAYSWFVQRKEVLEKLRQKQAVKPKKPEPSKAQILVKKMDYCKAMIKKHQKALKLQQTLVKKWTKKLHYYEKQTEGIKA